MEKPYKKTPFASLRVRLMLLVLIVIFPLIGLIVYSDIEDMYQRRTSVLNESLRHARNASLIYSQLITEARQTLFILSQIPEFQQQDREACSKILKSVLEKNEYLSNLAATKLNGDVFASAIASAKPINYADRKWFKRLVQTRSFVIGEYIIGRITGKPNIALGYPILNSNGQLSTILGLTLDLDRIGKRMAGIRLPEGASLTVIDNNGTVILRFPDPEKLVGKNMPENPIIKAILTQKEGVQEVIGLDGVRRLYGYTTIGSGIEAIHVSVSTPEQAAFAKVSRQTVRDFALVGLVGVLALLGAWLFGGLLIVSPAKTLLDFTKRVAEGDLTVRTGQSNVSGELGLLAHNFDRMAESLQRREEERKLAAETLRESEEKYRSLASAADSMYLVDRDCRFLLINERHLARIGLPAEQVIGRKHGEFHSTEDAVIFENYIKQVFETGESLQDEYRSARDGRYFVRTWSPVKNANGMTFSVTVISKDMTERNKAEEQLQDTLESLRKAIGMTLQVMVSAVETRDPYTAGHQIRSADLARAIAVEMDLPQDKIDAIRMAGSIHDIGKLSIPAEILSKPTKLSEIEFSLIKEHARKGYEMLKDVESPWPLAEIVRQHHERMDGSGYPQRLKGDDILMEARILAVADVVEAMASHRPYRPGLGIDAALNEIEKNSGICYDSAVADACLRLFREKGFKLEGIDYKR